MSTTTSPPSSDIAQQEALMAPLPAVSRLALAYAPRHARLPTLALLALDARLAGLLRHSREPMMAQLRLSWWRESLSQDASRWPEGEPLLTALKSWNGAHPALVALVDGWEELTGPAPLPAQSIEAMAEGRAAAFAALAAVLERTGEQDAMRRLGRQWALADLAMRLGHAQERETVRVLAAQGRREAIRVSRPLRPLMVLNGLAQRRLARDDEAAATSPAALLKAMRLGLLGF